MQSVWQQFYETIENVPIVIYVTDGCPYCAEAKRTIARAVQQLGYDPEMSIEVVNLDHMGSSGQQLKNVLLSATGRRTVPNIFVNGRNVGGNSEVEAFVRRRKLHALLRNALF